jgi:hypothetical protein
VDKHRITLFHQNIASILSKCDLFQIALKELKDDLGDIDIICLSETFLKKGSENNLKISGYAVASAYCRKERRGGTCILLKNDLDYKTYDIKESIPFAFECCAVEILQYNLIIICIYRTPSSKIDIFFNQLQLLLNRLLHKSNRKRIILAGDWNIDMMQSSKYSKELTGILANHNMTVHIKQPTRKAACLDLIVSNISSTVTSKIHCLCLSDHETGQSIRFKQPLTNYQRRPKVWFEKKRDMNSDNIGKFTRCISSLTFNEVYQEHGTELSFNAFHNLYKLFFDLCFPVITVKKVSKPIKNSWLTKGIRKCCLKKRCLYLKYRLDSSNKTLKKSQYTSYSKILKKCITNAQKNINSRYIANAKNVCKSVWDVIKHNVDNIGSKNDIKEIKQNDNTLIDNPVDICNEFNNYFINETNNCNFDDKTDFTEAMRNVPICCNSIYLTPVNENDIYKLIKNLKNTYSSGYDDIRTDVIKKTADYIVAPLTHIINLSLVQGHYPSALKRSVVRPLHKKGARDEKGNYRPITLIPILSKIFEKVMYDKLYAFASFQRILTNKQFGFRKNSSTTHACFDLIKHVTQNLDTGMTTLTIYFDMSKAFDHVSHKLLISKLDRYGIRGNALSWLKSYLCDREQCVEITRMEGCTKKFFKSNYLFNKYGVPQGSVMGPLLFLFYINDLPNITDQKCILFADDTTLIVRDKKDSIENLVNTELKKISHWLEINNLKLNIAKTKCIHFRTYNSILKKIDVKLNNNIIDTVEETKFLGITLDKFCNWKAHIESIVVRLDRFIYALNRVRQVASSESALMAYHGYVSSVLRYGIILWGNSVDAIRVFKIQKKCIRSICGAEYLDTCKPLFKKLKILPLPCLYVFEMGMFVKKNFHLFAQNKDIRTYRGRKGDDLCIPKQRINLYSKNAYCMSISIYNKFPDCIKILTINKFKKALFEFLTDKNYYSVNDFLNDKVK